MYLASFPKKHLRKNLSSYMLRLTDLAESAKVMRRNINDARDKIEFANFLLTTELSEKDLFRSIPEEYGQEYVTELDNLLKKLVRLPTAIKSSSLGENFRIGKSGPTGEPENIQWMQYMYGFWCQVLKRTFKSNSGSNSGREKFLIFCEDCFEPLYPSISANTLRNCLKVMEREDRNNHGTI